MEAVVKRGQEADHVTSQFVVPPAGGLGPGAHQEMSWRYQGGGPGQVVEDRPQLAAKPVAHHRPAHLAGDGERHPRRTSSRTVGGGQRTLSDPDALLPEGSKGVPTTDGLDQADSFARPLARRLRSTARPARVDIRARKPWFLARLRTLGWKVRFTWGFLLGAGSLDPAGADGGAGDD